MQTITKQAAARARGHMAARGTSREPVDDLDLAFRNAEMEAAGVRQLAAAPWDSDNDAVRLGALRTAATFAAKAYSELARVANAAASRARRAAR